MYRLVTNGPEKRVEENTKVSFLRHRQSRLHWFVACYVLLLTEIVRGLWSVTLEWIEFGCVHKLYPEESDCNCIPAVRRPKLVNEIGVIVRQYDRLLQQQLFLSVFDLWANVNSMQSTVRLPCGAYRLRLEYIAQLAIIFRRIITDASEELLADVYIENSGGSTAAAALLPSCLQAPARPVLNRISSDDHAASYDTQTPGDGHVCLYSCSLYVATMFPHLLSRRSDH